MSTLRRSVLKSLKILPAAEDLAGFLSRDYSIKERYQTEDDSLVELGKPEATNFNEGWLYGYEQACAEFLNTSTARFEELKDQYAVSCDTVLMSLGMLQKPGEDLMQ